MRTLSLKKSDARAEVSSRSSHDDKVKIRRTEEELKAELKKLKHEAFSKRREQVRAMRKFLTETHPEIFNMQAPKLLAINIHTELRKAYPQFSWQTLRCFLHKWCHHPLYIALDQGGVRYHLDGAVQIPDIAPRV